MFSTFQIKVGYILIFNIFQHNFDFCYCLYVAQFLNYVPFNNFFKMFGNLGGDGVKNVSGPFCKGSCAKKNAILLVKMLQKWHS